jgi:sulfonate transport system ATP-binding protein
VTSNNIAGIAMGSSLTVTVDAMRYPNSHGPGSPLLIDGLVFQAAMGERIAFLGRSGAGKTTLLRIVAGLERRFKGSVTIGDRVVAGPQNAVQLLFQDHRLLPWKTAFGNVAFATHDPSGRTTRAQVHAALERLGLGEKINEWPKNLSGGEVARVAIARALVSKPTLLLLDEPFQSLDVMTRHEVEQQLIIAIEGAKPTVLMVSHDIEDAVFMSDTVHILSHRPMRIAKSFHVPTAHPRQRGAEELARISAEILEYVSKSMTSDAGDRQQSHAVARGTV